MRSTAYATEALIFNLVLVVGLALERWRGAPWLAILIPGGIALPLANILMFLKHKRTLQRSIVEVPAP